MSFKKKSFVLTTSALSIALICYTDSFAAQCIDGTYNYGGPCYACKPGCYCKNPSYQLAGILSCDAQNQVLKFGAIKKSSGTNGAYLCPKDYPNSPEGAKSEEECYKSCSGFKAYNKKIDCKAGEYLHYKSNSCQKCAGSMYVGSNQYCPGANGLLPSCGMNNQGLQDCPSGKKPNADKTACIKEVNFTCPSNFPKYDDSAASVSDCYYQCTPPGGTQKIYNKKIHVEPGYMLKYRKTTPEKCDAASNEYCPGGDFYADCSQTQGKSTCGSGKVPNADKTACIADETTCDKGWYLKKGESSCSKCKTGTKDVCDGGTFTVKPSSDKGIRQCDGDKVADSEHKNCIAPAAPEPAQAPAAPAAPAAPEAPKEIPCDKGWYLKKGESSCSKCKTGTKDVCDGGTFTEKPSEDKGIRKCDGDLVADDEHKTCVSKTSGTITCDPSQYLPANATKCKKCKSGLYYVCEGGEFPLGTGFEQGIRKCDGNMVANEIHSACVESTGKIIVYEGKYLPANSTSPTDCVGAKRYCPGGSYAKKSVDQGIFDCPLNGRANAAKTACTITLTKTQMKYGVLGTKAAIANQCWNKTKEPEKFKECVFGSRYYK